MAEKCDRCPKIFDEEDKGCLVRLSWQTWETTNLCHPCMEKQKPASIASYWEWYNSLPEIEKVQLDHPVENL